MIPFAVFVAQECPTTPTWKKGAQRSSLWIFLPRCFEIVRFIILPLSLFCVLIFRILKRNLTDSHILDF